MAVDVNKIKSITWTMLLLLTTTIIASGILFIYLFSREIFFKTDLIKLLLLASSITIPVWLINTALYLIYNPLHKTALPGEEDEYLQVGAMVGCAFSMGVIYLPILIKFFFGINVKVGVIIILSVELVFGILYALGSSKENKNKN